MEGLRRQAQRINSAIDAEPFNWREHPVRSDSNASRPSLAGRAAPSRRIVGEGIFGQIRWNRRRASPANWSRELWLAAEPATIQLLAAVTASGKVGCSATRFELSTTPTSSDSIADDTPAHGPGGRRPAQTLSDMKRKLVQIRARSPDQSDPQPAKRRRADMTGQKHAIGVWWLC